MTPAARPCGLVCCRLTGRHKVSDRIMEAAGLPRLTSHEWGRHAFATEMMVRNDVDPVTTARSGGWETPKLLFDRYAHANPDRAVINQVFSTRKQ